MNGTVERR